MTLTLKQNNDYTITTEEYYMKKIKIYAEVLEDDALKQFNDAMALDCNVQGALMPDAHIGYTLPIGAVIKSKGVIFPSYIGYDIGCGMCAVKVNVKKDDINIEALKEHILKNIPIGFNKREEPLAINLDMNMASYFLLSNLKNAEYQLGTLGGGNHFIEIGKSQEDGNIWIIIHSGSRNLGHKIASHYMEIAAIQSINMEELKQTFSVGKEIFKEKNPVEYSKAENKFIESSVKNVTGKNIEGHYGFNVDSNYGKQYLADMDFCLEYALLNRKIIIENIIDGIRTKTSNLDILEFINRNHNHAELKDGFVVHRKGATHAEKGMLGVIPGNMKDGSFIVEGLGNEDSMCSSSHGAGRALSRKKAKEQLSLEEFNSEMLGIATNHTDETIDEAPRAYKNIFEVMEQQKDLVRILDRCVPFLNIKG